jgi:hypothetical protein
MFNRAISFVAILVSSVVSFPDSAAARGGGGGGHGGGGGGGHFGGGHFGGWGGRGYGYGGYGWGGYRGYGWRGYGWGFPSYGYGLGLGLGVGLGYGLYGGYGYGYGGYPYGYSAYGYGYPGYAYYGYDPYATGPAGGYGPGYGPTTSSGTSTSSSAWAPAMTADSSARDATGDFADQGETAFKNGNYSGAMYALRHAAVDDPNNAVVTLLLGHALFATGKFDEAAGATQAAMRQLPHEKWGVVISHYTELYGDTKDYTRQLRALEAALKVKPDDPALRFLAGFHYAYLGFTQEAIDQLEKTLKLAPRDEMARQLRDELRGKLGKTSVPPLPPAPEIRNGPALDTE